MRRLYNKELDYYYLGLIDRIYINYSTALFRDKKLR